MARINYMLKKVLSKLIETIPRAQHSYLSLFNLLIKDFFKHDDNKKVLNLGCGGTRYGKNHINLDISVSNETDIIADAHYLPFSDNSFDIIFSGAVLEHVRNPFKVLDEIYRVLSPEGRLFITIPFLYPFHVSPGTQDDYFRVTNEACKEIFSKFNIKKIGIMSGPATAFCLITNGFVEVILLRIIKHTGIVGILMLFVGWFIYPIKFIDRLLIRLPEAHKYSAMFYIIASKEID